MTELLPAQVVIIDDDDAVLDSFRFMLQAAGVPVTTYPSAAHYLDSGVTPPRCLILDQHMPRMTGLELAERLRADGNERVLQKPPSEDKILCFVAACA
jgi:FixJ family two-component response regulator